MIQQDLYVEVLLFSKRCTKDSWVGSSRIRNRLNGLSPIKVIFDGTLVCFNAEWIWKKWIKMKLTLFFLWRLKSWASLNGVFLGYLLWNSRLEGVSVLTFWISHGDLYFTESPLTGWLFYRKKLTGWKFQLWHTNKLDIVKKCVIFYARQTYLLIYINLCRHYVHRNIIRYCVYA